MKINLATELKDVRGRRIVVGVKSDEDGKAVVVDGKNALEYEYVTVGWVCIEALSANFIDKDSVNTDLQMKGSERLKLGLLAQKFVAAGECVIDLPASEANAVLKRVETFCAVNNQGTTIYAQMHAILEKGSADKDLPPEKAVAVE